MELPASTRVRAAAADVLRFETLRFQATAGVLLVARHGSTVLCPVSHLCVEPEVTMPPGWRSAIAGWPPIRAGVAQLPRLFTGADVPSTLRRSPAAAVLALPLGDGRDTVGMVLLWLGSTWLHRLAHGEDVWRTHGSVSAAPLLRAQEHDDAERRTRALERSIAEMRIVEQAKGVLAAHLRTTPDDAMAQLLAHCRQRDGVSVCTVAQAVVGAAILGRVPLTPSGAIDVPSASGAADPPVTHGGTRPESPVVGDRS